MVPTLTIVVSGNTCNFPMYTGKEDARWQPLFKALRRKLGPQSFETWFRPLRLSGDSTNHVLQIAAPNRVVRDWILTHYASALKESLQESNLSGFRVEWIQSAITAIPLQTNVSRNLPLYANGGADVPPLPEMVPPERSTLNEKYTFDNFVVGSSNRLAHAAARAVCESPGKTYNPLYLYGGVGLGKTHLIQAIGHAVAKSNPSLRVAYLSLERFMNELIGAIRYGSDKTNSFRERYRRIDILLIDDVQFITGKVRTQEEFFHTFNALYDQQKQIVMTSDCPPKDIAEIEERLHSRFEWGLIADIDPPDLETKVAIVKGKAQFHGTEIPDEVALCLATHNKHNIRELEGSLVRLLAMASLRDLPLTKALAEESMRVVSSDTPGQNVSIEKIQKIVAGHYKIDTEVLKARSSVRSVLLPRQVAMYLCKRLTKESYPEIARQFGGKHHTTVIHSVDKIEKTVRSYSELATTVSKLIENIQK